MQASLASPLPGSLDRYSSGEMEEFLKITEDFSRKVRVNYYVTIPEEEEKPEHEPEEDDRVVVVAEEDEEEEEEEEFTFAITNLDGSPISAAEVFQDGQIRPIYPVFDQSLLYAELNGGDSTSKPSPRRPLKKLFVEERDPPSSSFSSTETNDDLGAAAVGPFCEWSRKVVEASPEACKKSNSTGFSKRWRFRDLVHRSSSDGKDAFVFLSSQKSEKVPKEIEKVSKKETTAGGKAKKTTPSAHELHYVKNRAMREEDKRRSYLPYRQGVVGVGFFTSVNGLSKNIHPY